MANSAQTRQTRGPVVRILGWLALAAVLVAIVAQVSAYKSGVKDTKVKTEALSHSLPPNDEQWAFINVTDATDISEGWKLKFSGKTLSGGYYVYPNGVQRKVSLNGTLKGNVGRVFKKVGYALPLKGSCLRYDILETTSDNLNFDSIVIFCNNDGTWSATGLRENDSAGTKNNGWDQVRLDL